MLPGGRQSVRRVRPPACPYGSPSLGPPASCRPSGAFAWNPHETHRERVRRRRPPARTQASPVSALRRAPAGPPRWERRHPAGPTACSPGTHMGLTGSECTDAAPRRAPKRPPCPPSGVPLRVPRLGVPASCRPSGAFAWNPHETHRERVRRRRPPARTKASPVSTIQRAPAGPPAGSAGILPAQRRVRQERPWDSPGAIAPTMPPGAHQSVPRVRPPACTCGSPPLGAPASCRPSGVFTWTRPSPTTTVYRVPSGPAWQCGWCSRAIRGSWRSPVGGSLGRRVWRRPEWCFDPELPQAIHPRSPRFRAAAAKSLDPRCKRGAWGDYA